MALELATILLGLCVGAVAVLYAAPRGYLGHRKAKAAKAETIDSYATKVEQANEVPTKDATTVSSPVPSPQANSAPAPAIYESVQPTPAPFTYSAPSKATFGAHTLAKKPTRTYRRRTAPIRSAGPKKTLHKPKKR